MKKKLLACVRTQEGHPTPRRAEVLEKCHELPEGQSALATQSTHMRELLAETQTWDKWRYAIWGHEISLTRLRCHVGGEEGPEMWLETAEGLMLRESLKVYWGHGAESISKILEDLQQQRGPGKFAFRETAPREWGGWGRYGGSSNIQGKNKRTKKMMN